MIKFIEFRRVNVRYSDKGIGRTIILLHGFMESLEIWNDFSKALSNSYRVISIDLPGFGETPHIGYVHSMEMMAKCVKAVADKEKLRRYIIVGHSMGGYVALAFAELFNDNLKGLALFHSTAFPDSDEKKIQRNKAIDIVKKNSRNYINIFFEPLFAPHNVSAHKNDIKLLEERASKYSKIAIVNALEGMKDRKKRDWIIEMAKFPILFIIGRLDVAIPYLSVLNQSKLVKNPSILLLENVGHMGFLEAREQTLKAVRTFARCYTSKL